MHGWPDCVLGEKHQTIVLSTSTYAIAVLWRVRIGLGIRGWLTQLGGPTRRRKTFSSFFPVSVNRDWTKGELWSRMIGFTIIGFARQRGAAFLVCTATWWLGRWHGRFCSCFLCEQAHLFSNLADEDLHSDSFARSAMDERSNRCHAGVGGEQLSTNFVGRLLGVEIGRDVPVESVCSPVFAQ